MKDLDVRENPIAIPTAAKPPPNDAQRLPDLIRQGLAFARRGWLTIMLLSIVGMLLSVAFLSQLDRRYQSTVRVLVESPQRSPIESEQLSASLLETFVEGQVFLVESTEVLHAVVQRENLTDLAFFQSQPPSLPRRLLDPLRSLLSPAQAPATEDEEIEMDPAEAAALRTLRRNLSISRERRANIIRIDVTADSARTAARIANAVAEAFVETRIRDQRERATQMADWIDNRALELQERLSRAEDAVASFREEYNLLSASPDRTLSDQQLSELNSELIRTRAALAERNAAYRRARAMMEQGGDMQTLPEIQRSEIVTGLRTRLLELERRESELSRRGGSTLRTGLVAEEREALEAQLAAEIARLVEQMRNEVETLQAREELVVAVLSEAGSESGVASRLSVRLRELERRAAAYQALYERYLSSGGLAEEAASFLPVGVTIIDRATLPNAPVYPPTRVILLFGLLLGAGLGTLVAFFRDAMRAGYLTAQQVEDDLGLPVLTSMPQLGRDVNAFDLALEQPLSPLAEATRTLRNALSGQALPGKAGQIVMLTSSSAGEGKTNLSAALAASALSAGLRVMLIDADLRRAGLTRLFGMNEEKGLAEILRGRGWSFAPRGPRAELEILSAGQDAPGLADRLASHVMKRYLNEARAHYDLIILDGPPVANLADAPILASSTDAVAFVVRWSVTPREIVRQALNRLGHHNVRGIVLNNVDFATSAKYGDSYESYVAIGPEPVRKGGGATA